MSGSEADMTVRQLSRDQLTELKQRMIDDEIYKKEGRSGDFFCTAGK